MLPKTGTRLQKSSEWPSYSRMVAMTLRQELGSTHSAVKTIMRWTGACERTVKNWLSEESAPSGEHLIELMRHSDCILRVVLQCAERDTALVASEMAQALSAMKGAVAAIERTIPEAVGAPGPRVLSR